MGDGEPAERPCEVEVVSRRLPFPVRYGLVALAGARGGAARGRRLRDGDLRGRRGRRGGSRDGRSSRSSSPTRPTSARGATGSSAGRSRSSSAPAPRPVRLLKRAADARARRARHDRRAERLPRRRSPAGWGLDREPDPRAHEPGAAAARRRAGAARARDVRLRRAADAAEGARRRDRRRSRACRTRGSSSSATGPERASSSAHAAASGAAGRIEFLGSRSRDEALAIVAGARRRACSRATGRTCRTRPSRRCRSACRSSRRRSAACPRSSTTARTACSCRPADPDALAAALRRMLEEPGLRDRLAAAAKPSVAAISSDASTAGSRRSSRRRAR